MGRWSVGRKRAEEKKECDRGRRRNEELNAKGEGYKPSEGEKN